ncbi:MAG: KH domain-containing protein [Anaerolineales bacterium]|nr:KH domain-containing protein [Anaerolineales bacterium]
MEPIKEFVEYIVKSLVSNHEHILVNVSEEQGTVRVNVNVAQEDMGRIIGRKGRTVNSIRSLLRVLGSEHGMRVELDIE